MAAIQEDAAVTNFREYLRIPSVHPNVNYDGCVAFLQRQARELQLPVQTVEVAPGNPVVVITWCGAQPELPSVMLNSHMDVVPVFPEEWSHDPFAADKDASGNIYARGAQDMKCVGIQYLEAVRRLRSAGVTSLRRTLHITFMPDEEVGGVNGMNKFVKTREFQQLNVGFALDEGIASTTDEYLVFYGERVICSNVVVHCPGTPGHGSLLLPDTAGEKLRHVIDRFMDFRRSEQIRLEQDAKLTIGDVTTVNLTIVQGGVQYNVVPPEMTATFDIRIATDVDLVKFKEMLAQWCREAGPGITIEYRYEPKSIPNTKLDDSNPFWVAFNSECLKMNINMEPRIFCGATDARFIRELGIPALGFSPMVRTPVLLHAHDEFLNERVFLDGIAIYEKLIPAVANVP